MDTIVWCGVPFEERTNNLGNRACNSSERVNGYSLRSLAIFTGYDTISVFHDITLLP